MQFRRIKYANFRVELEWQEERKDKKQTTEHRLNSSDEPLPYFKDAMAAFKLVVLKLLELDEDWGEKLTVQSVAINEEQDGRLGCVVTCLRSLKTANAPVVINTPHMREDVDGKGEKGLMPPTMLDCVLQLEGAAMRYLQGDRVQKDMFTKEPEAEKRDLDDRTTVEVISGGTSSGKMTMGEFERRLEQRIGSKRAKERR